MDIDTFEKKQLKVLERIATALEKLADTKEIDEESKPVKGFNAGGTD